MKKTEALSVEGLTVGYGKVPIVHEASMEAAAGKIVTVVGPNGAGKSTLLKGLFGVRIPTEGKVFVDGTEVTGLRPNRMPALGMAYVPQVANVFPSMSVIENLEMGAFILPVTEVAQRVGRVLDIFPDLKLAARRKAGTLSGGQRNMLAMARSLMLDPKVVLLDEPTAGLSPAYTKVVWAQVGRIAGTGAAVVVVEQNVDLAMRHADWVYAMVAGRNRWSGAPGDISRSELTDMFLGRGGGEAARKAES